MPGAPRLTSSLTKSVAQEIPISLRAAESAASVKDLESSINDYQMLIRLNNLIEKKFQNTSKKISQITKEKISKIISRLPPYFKRIHRSFIVNSQKVSSYNSEFISVEGSQIPISRTYKKDIITYLNKI